MDERRANALNGTKAKRVYETTTTTRHSLLRKELLKICRQLLLPSGLKPKADSSKLLGNTGSRGGVRRIAYNC